MNHSKCNNYAFDFIHCIYLLSLLSGALDQQKEIYEQKLEELRRERTPDTSSGRTSSGYNSEDRVLNSTPTSFYDRCGSNFMQQFVVAFFNKGLVLDNVLTILH